ncbi:TIGR01777 family oxidoreductase [Comamonas sp.]|uniref:TIGR01777 family oxidoreductase n=1 Tax=Comamonas sp. TaxID=34028 RepID=UPI0012C199CA|nr:TIGR01777 family oxidoreductase [Comamonas sp.]MPT10248.1 TIGR01777 family protein [Comamonas sp.]
MRILLTGGTGLIGQALCRLWRSQGHDLWVWSRTPQQVEKLCQGSKGIAHLDSLDGSAPFDAVVNLAGAPIATHRWSAERCELLWNSRIDLTRTLVDWMGRQVSIPQVLISGSAVGWYGDGEEQWLSEDSSPGNIDFGSRLCVAWEQEAARARQQLGVRVVLLRTAPVLTAAGGMLARLLPSFKRGLGCRLGSGQQWMPWIHIDDQVALIDYLLKDESCSGPYNACAPGVVRNVDFTQMLARELGKPAVFHIPTWALRLALGEMSVLLLEGQRLVPQRAQEAGFSWRYPELSGALKQLLRER